MNSEEVIGSLWKMFNQSSNALSKLLGRTNNIVGEYAEYLACQFIGGEMLAPSNKSADIQDSDGNLYQVKARKVSNLTTQLSVIRSWDFNYLIVILFDFEGVIIKGVKLPVSTAKKCSVYNEHQNGWVISTTENFFNQEEIEDITNNLNRIDVSKITDLKISVNQSIDNIDKRIHHTTRGNITKNDQKEKFSKSDAFKIIAQKHNYITNSNCSYSSPNRTTGNWWLEPKIKKFEKDLYLILYDDKNSTLHLLKIPAMSFRNVEEQLYTREEKEAVSINIPFSEDMNFIDSHSNLSFNRFYVETFKI